MTIQTEREAVVSRSRAITGSATLASDPLSTVMARPMAMAATAQWRRGVGNPSPASIGSVVMVYCVTVGALPATVVRCIRRLYFTAS